MVAGRLFICLSGRLFIKSLENEAEWMKMEVSICNTSYKQRDGPQACPHQSVFTSQQIFEAEKKNKNTLRRKQQSKAQLQAEPGGSAGLVSPRWELYLSLITSYPVPRCNITAAPTSPAVKLVHQSEF